MKKKLYVEPVLEIINLELEEICASSADNDSSWTETLAEPLSEQDGY